MNSSHLTRRELLQSAAVSGALAMVQTSPAADDKFADHPYIDAHSHVWSPDTAKWPLANNKTQADLDPLSFTPEELLKLAHAEKVARGVEEARGVEAPGAVEGGLPERAGEPRGGQARHRQQSRCRGRRCVPVKRRLAVRRVIREHLLEKLWQRQRRKSRM